MHPVFNFENSYLNLPSQFYSCVEPTKVENPEIVLLNSNLIETLHINATNSIDLLAILSGNKIPNNTKPFAQAYAGHQFGHFTILGDGRAIMLGEHLNNKHERYDIQLKGCGKTPYSRQGDGRATYKAMLREYLISEALHFLNIPTSRSLAVVKHHSPVFRENIEIGAILTRVMKSHLRIGTFEYAHFKNDNNSLKLLANYSLLRLYPEKNEYSIPALNLLNEVMVAQINLVVEWMRVGFIHGVMNTDNTSLSGESFDFGPCAFINTYNPATVFSSIDYQGRYSFKNQPFIIKWNLYKFAETLIPIIHQDLNIAIKLAQEMLNRFDDLWLEAYYQTFIHKIGFEKITTKNKALVDELLDIMFKNNLDYTNTFLLLTNSVAWHEAAHYLKILNDWIMKWEQLFMEYQITKNSALMVKNNPVYIPRPHLVEEALNEAVKGQLTKFLNVLNVLKNPYNHHDLFLENIVPPNKNFEQNYQTYCGT
ncbi:MAG: YdiU family protein [Alphaproteobacteria bacterium]|nr:YdiU family protein [Alphaproteobacteria bacterium]